MKRYNSPRLVQKRDSLLLSIESCLMISCLVVRQQLQKILIPYFPLATVCGITSLLSHFVTPKSWAKRHAIHAFKDSNMKRRSMYSATRLEPHSLSSLDITLSISSFSNFILHTSRGLILVLTSTSRLPKESRTRSRS